MSNPYIAASKQSRAGWEAFRYETERIYQDVKHKRITVAEAHERTQAALAIAEGNSKSAFSSGNLEQLRKRRFIP